MNWKGLGKTLAGIGAPLLANLIPGGGIAANLITSAIGADVDPDDPDAIANAIARDPAAATRIRELELQHQSDLQQALIKREIARAEADTAQQASINATMRAEVASDGWYKSGWRPFIGWITGASVGSILAALALAIFRDPGTAPKIVEQATVILGMALGVLGYNVRQRTVDKLARMGKEPKGLIEQLGNLRKGESA